MTDRATRLGGEPGVRLPVDEDVLGRAVAAYAQALRLSCHAAREPARAALTNDAVAAHRTAREWAEALVRLAASTDDACGDGLR